MRPWGLGMKLHVGNLGYLYSSLFSPPAPRGQDVGMPAEYVNKLARMFQDIKVSEDLNGDFKEIHRGSQVAGRLKPSIPLASSQGLLASYPGLPLQLCSQPWKSPRVFPRL